MQNRARQTLFVCSSATVAVLLTLSSGHTWDSYVGNPRNPTHTRLTEWALEELRHEFPALYAHRKALIEGANAEMHEGTLFVGDKPGSEDPEQWWHAAEDLWRAGNDDGYYLYLGVILHLVQDMGVPAHAHGVAHTPPFGDPGNADARYDAFELLAYDHWDPDFRSLNRHDPGLEEPWQYVKLSRDWTLADTPGFDAAACPKAWSAAPEEYRFLVRARQARSAAATKWALRSAALKRLPRFHPDHQDADTAVLRVTVKTATDKDAGTDDLIFFSIGKRSWWLNIPMHNDFEPGQEDTFVLAPVHRSDLERIEIRKGRDITGAWKLAALKVHLNSHLLYQKEALNLVLNNQHPTWRAPEFGLGEG